MHILYPKKKNRNSVEQFISGERTTTDNFSNLDWSSNSYWIKTNYDLNNDNNFEITGTIQNGGLRELVSVPYALYSNYSGTAGPTGAPSAANLRSIACPMFSFPRRL